LSISIPNIFLNKPGFFPNSAIAFGFSGGTTPLVDISVALITGEFVLHAVPVTRGDSFL
jgi:hypothetical protein